MKVIVAGSRTLPGSSLNRADMWGYLSELKVDLPFDEVVSGGAKGVDTFGEVWAGDWDVPVKRFPANWAKHGRAAGVMRNAQMAEYADACVVFWDGKSPGSADMIMRAVRSRLKLFVYTLDSAEGEK